MQPGIKLNNICEGLVVVRAAILTMQFSRHARNDVSVEGGVGDMQGMISQKRVSKPNIRDPSVEITRTLKVHNVENNIVFPIEGQPGCLETSHEVCEQESREVGRRLNPCQDRGIIEIEKNLRDLGHGCDILGIEEVFCCPFKLKYHVVRKGSSGHNWSIAWRILDYRCIRGVGGEGRHGAGISRTGIGVGV